MRLYMKQRVFTWRDKFTVYDEEGRDKYYVEGELLSWGKRLHIYDLQKREIAFVRQRLFHFFPNYAVEKNGRQVAEVRKHFSFFRPVYSVSGPAWDMNGDFWAHEYQIVGNKGPVASISKRWFTIGDAYEINIVPDADELTVLGTVLAMDACLAANN